MLTAAGWVGSYYSDGTPDSSPQIVQHNALVDFDWGQRSPLDNTSDSDGFSARWESNLQSDHTATHQLILRTNPDDGLRVWVDDQLTVDAWDGTGTSELTADVGLIADLAASVRVEYRDIAGESRIWLGWTSPELPVEVVGPEWTPLSDSQQQVLEDVASQGVLFEQLSTVSADFLDSGDVFYSDVASGSVLTSADAAASSTTHPAQRLRGYFVPETSGTYQLRISGGDANRLLLADDSDAALARVVASSDSPPSPGQWDADSNQTSDAIELVAGVRYYFEARQMESGSYDGLEIQWRQTGLNWESITVAQLRPVQADVGVRAVVSAVNETDESATVSFDMSRSDDFGRDLVVNMNYGGTASRDADYAGATSTVTIPAGQRSARVELTVANDEVDELLETINVGVAASSDYALASPVRTRTTLSIFGNLVPEGNSIIGEDPLDLANVASINGTNYATFSNRTANGENGGTINGTVLVVDTTTTPPNDTSVWARWNIDQNIDESETLYAEFYYRRLGTLWSPLTFNVRTTSPFADVGRTEVTAKGFWQRAQIPITLGDSISSAASRVEMFLGERVAKVEIANFQVKRFVSSLENAAAALPLDAGTVADTDIKSGQGTYATFTDRATTAAEQVPFDNALIVDVHTSASFLSQIRAGWYTDHAVEENSILTVEAWLRTDDAPFDVRLQVEQSPAVNRNLLKENFQATNTWTKHQFVVTARQASQPGELRLEALFGRSVGTLEIGGVQIWNHGAAPDLTQHLPQSYLSYAEREADSDWRWEAQQSVLENRRHPLTVNVTNLAGAPIAGAVVEVNQLEHAYGFGNILKTEFISDIGGGQASDPASQRHAAIASRLFNTITIANGIRWVPWDQNRDRGIDTVDWVNDNVDSLHGHHLTWGQLSFVPSAVRNEYARLQNDVSQAAAREYLRTEQLAHVADIASELGNEIAGTDRPQVAHWDTVNHPVLLKEIWNILRDGGSLADPIGEIFDAAKANSHPDTLQMINKGQTIEFVDHERRTEYYNLIQELLDNGNPVEAVGFMNHFGLADAPTPTQFNAHLDEFAALGLPLGMTEFDINATGTDLQTQADWSEDYFLNVFANPATEFIISYGFYQLAHWRHDVGGHWYTSDWEAKPNGEVYVDQVHREWQTNTRGSSRADGSYRTMAFDGRQQVTVTVDGQSYLAIAEVDENGGIVNVAIDRPIVVDGNTRIEAEYYNGGGEGVGYSDTTVGNTGTDYRSDQNVDIGANSDEGEPGFSVGWARGGEWLEYTVDVEGGAYDISVRVASNHADPGDLRLVVRDGTNFTVLETFAVESTGGWNNWQTLTVEDVSMIAFDGADQVFRLEMVGGNFNINWFEFKAAQSAPTDITLSSTNINENLSTDSADRLFATLFATDNDSGDTHSFDLVAGTGDDDNSRFVIVDDQLMLKQGEILDYETQSQYSVRLEATDSAGLKFEKEVQLDVNNLVEFSKSDIEIGSSNSRSRITTVAVSFDGPVTIDSGAFVVTKRGSDGGVVNVSHQFRSGSNNQIVDLTFSSEFVEFGSLVDGNYQLDIVAGKVFSNTGHGIDTNSDGDDSDSVTFGDVATDNFFRLFGDYDGNRTVNVFDLLGFRTSYRKSLGDAGYLADFDSNGDDTINVFDLLKFRTNYRQTLDFE
ncbi:endo-1,4-beta-xylanase [Mariniblastus fucicola]|uniref:endo-1,4-beta-xylanase n=1 Tax=Mariniblastus fucicola TaxID=980251 RepID=A0A5B9PKE6_9BACT|nr:endo-1,4-beta-xylanase [Mariniblastus fucicola]QEG22893.1 Endo-1,4-beta-xylanase A precursor [Mariniblastus fucicola]